MELRGIQKGAIEAIYQSFRGGGTYHLINCSVAFGKTIVAAELMRSAKGAHGAKCLFVAHLKELVIQTVEKFNLVAPEISCGTFMGSTKKVKDITVGTRQTISRNLASFPKVNLIIFDEVHLYSEQSQMIVDYFLRLNPRLRVLGVTGTPFMTKGWIYGEGKIWPEPCFEAGINEMIGLGYLSPYRYKLADKMDELKNLKLSGGDFRDSDLEDIMTQDHHMGTIKHVLAEYCAERKKIMVFCVTIEHAEKLSAYLGVKCVHSKIHKDEWRKRVDDFKHGDSRILVNVSQLTIGFDAEAVDCLIVARPTMSTALHVQICGRGLRVNGGDCLILDMVGNYLRHGLPSNPKVLLTKERKAGKGGENVCPQCLEVVESGTICPYCGAELTEKKEIIELNAEVAMREVKEKRFRVIRWWEKKNAVTRRGFTGSRFCVKLEKKMLYKFCSSGSKGIDKVRKQLNKLDSDVSLISTAYGDWIA